MIHSSFWTSPHLSQSVMIPCTWETLSVPYSSSHNTHTPHGQQPILNYYLNKYFHIYLFNQTYEYPSSVAVKTRILVLLSVTGQGPFIAVVGVVGLVRTVTRKQRLGMGWWWWCPGRERVIGCPCQSLVNYVSCGAAWLDLGHWNFTFPSVVKMFQKKWRNVNRLHPFWFISNTLNKMLVLVSSQYFFYNKNLIIFSLIPKLHNLVRSCSLHSHFLLNFIWNEL